MSERKVKKHSLLATLMAFAIACSFSSCASSTNQTDDANSAASDSLLDDSAKVGATEVDDSAAFADLVPNDAGEKKKEAAPAKGEDVEHAASVVAENDSGDAFYSSLGGETIRRVAFTLYSDKSFAQRLLEKNPDLKGMSKLSPEQKVFFDISSVRPEPTYLTKDLLDRYAAPLSERVTNSAAEKGVGKNTVTVSKGESLQSVSQRLYGTTRYWTEIYLVNRDKIHNYDKVPAGITLAVLDHPGMNAAAHKQPEPMDARTAELVAAAHTPAQPEPMPVAEQAKPLPMVAPVAPLPTQPEPTPVSSQPAAPVAEASPPPPADPIPETPPAPPPVVESVKSAPAAAKVETVEPTSSNSGFRRILYIALILAIGGGAFYFTRTPKRPKVDMLDATSDATARPKLTKDSQKHNIG